MKGVPFLMSLSKDLSKEDELPFVFCSPGEVESFIPREGSSLRVHSRDLYGASAVSQAFSGEDRDESHPSACHGDGWVIR